MKVVAIGLWVSEVGGNIFLRRASLAIGLALGLLLLVLALRSVEPAGLRRALALTNPWFVLMALLSVAATVTAKALRWRLLFYPENDSLRVRSLICALLVGQTINLLLPARLGEFARAYLLGEIEKRRKLHALGTIVVEKLLDGLALLLLLGLVFLVLPVQDWLRMSGALAALATVLLLAAVLLLTGQRQRILALLGGVGRRVPLPGWLRPEGRFASFVDGLSSPRSIGVSARLIAWTAVIWFLGAATNYLVLVGMQIQVPLVLASLVVLVVVHLGLVVPTSPARIGVFHYLCLLSLSMLGVEQAQALAYGLVLHFVVVLPVLVAGLVCLWRENLTLYHLVAEAEKE
jgi:uncharacterized protein (TIRG00374 family)